MLVLSLQQLALNLHEIVVGVVFVGVDLGTQACRNDIGVIVVVIIAEIFGVVYVLTCLTFYNLRTYLLGLVNRL